MTRNSRIDYEVALKQRMKNSANLHKEMTHEEVGKIQEIPLDTLKHTRESSPGMLSSPEYWLDWFQKTLADSEVAQQANRDFQQVKSVIYGPTKATDIGGDPDSTWNHKNPSGKRQSSRLVDSSIVEENIAVCMCDGNHTHLSLEEA